MLFLLIIIAIILVLIFTGSLFITTSGCTIPIDLVLGDTCVFGSFGATLGLTIASVVGFALLGFVGAVLKNFFAKLTNRE